MTTGRQRPLILNVDDDEPGRYAMSRQLRRFEFDVIEARDGAKALTLAADECPDLILLDVRLPDMSGFAVCRELKSNHKTDSIPILHLSATSIDDHSRVMGLESGADGYLTEPVEPTVLRATIHALLRMRRAEQRVRRAALDWQSTFDAIGDGLASVDANGAIRRVNKSLSRMTGRSAEELAGTSWEDLFPVAGQESTFQKMLRTGERESSTRVHAGQMLRFTCDPAREESGALVGGVCIVADVTEHHRLEEQIRQTQKLQSIGLLAGGVAHDFNNLLTCIIGNASLAQEMVEATEVSPLLAEVIQAGERAAALTKQLLAYAGKGSVYLRVVNLTRLVRDMLPLIRTAVPRHIDLVLDFADDRKVVKADTTQLEQVIMNLVINAAEAIGDSNGKVYIGTSRRELADASLPPGFFAEQALSAGEYACLAVRDTGCGMDEQTRQNIFEPFFTTKFMGRGLGLSAVLGIVRSHGGALRVDSAPGRGSSFEILLPVTAEGTVTKPEKILAVSDSSAGVLVVDDEDMVRSIVKTALGSCGYRVFLAVNGLQAIQVLSQNVNDIGIVLLDLTMPVMNGREALPHLMRMSPHLKVLVLSGHGEDDVMREFADQEVTGFLPKPFTAKVLTEKVRQIANVKAQQTSGD